MKAEENFICKDCDYNMNYSWNNKKEHHICILTGKENFRNLLQCSVDMPLDNEFITKCDKWRKKE